MFLAEMSQNVQHESETYRDESKCAVQSLAIPPGDKLPLSLLVLVPALLPVTRLVLLLLVPFRQVVVVVVVVVVLVMVLLLLLLLLVVRLVSFFSNTGSYRR
ncbi:hypothetical protein E2C01_004479 [Portunus trituberculatus]|uniref:Uncharacterized protein n=1 Tax=Portunus trituberculatus TaxID=210409 RepID=A0A5B7CT36_PORTR|nr:hypothetical protein [Portunus trituberculatus]